MKKDTIHVKKWNRPNIDKENDDLIVEILAEAIRSYRRRRTKDLNDR